jgi:hypothetical protein
MEDLVGQSVLGVDLRRHVARDPEGADYLALLVAKRALCGRDPGTGPVAERLLLQLSDHRLACADDPLLVSEGDSGVFLGEEVEVRFPDDLLQGAARGCRGQPTGADQEKPALQVLEVDALDGAVQKVAHADALDLEQRLARERGLWIQLALIHRNSCSATEQYYRPIRQ